MGTVSHRLHAGRSTKGGRFMLLGVACILFLLLVQFLVYEREWDQLSRKSRTGKTLHNLFKLHYRRSWFSSTTLPDNDLNGSLLLESKESDISLKQVVEAVTTCIPETMRSASADSEAMKKTSDCLASVSAQHPPLGKLIQLSRQSNQERNSSKKSPDKVLVEALESHVVTLNKMLQMSTVFLELKDTRESGLTDTDRTWFMSSLRGQSRNGFPESFDFPSAEDSQGRLLCMLGDHTADGTQNKYGFAWKGHLPPGAVLLPGLTVVADNYWDYQNPWHAMSALVSFISWREQQLCVVAERVLLYHWGELVPSMGSWITNVLHAGFGRPLYVEALSHGNRPVCFERAIVNRRGLGGMSLPNMNAMIDTIRCTTRRFCGVVPKIHKSDSGGQLPINVTLFVRSSGRAFTNVSGVEKIIHDECEKAGGCQLEVARVSDLDFCQQVALMTRTDVLISTHGAQLTNMMFMPIGASVMEMMPKGWLEFAGVGQYIYQWLSDWARVHHEGIWRDAQGPDCPYPHEETLKCLFFHKDIDVNHDESHLRNWTAKVLARQKAKTVEAEELPSSSCPCDGVDRV